VASEGNWEAYPRVQRSSAGRFSSEGATRGPASHFTESPLFVDRVVARQPSVEHAQLFSPQARGEPVEGREWPCEHSLKGDRKDRLRPRVAGGSFGLEAQKLLSSQPA